MNVENPFNLKDLREIPLPRAPLVRVIAQVRFPDIASIEDAKFIGAFQESLRTAYPIMRPEKAVFLELRPNEIEKREKINWRMFDANEHWRLTLATDFLALETTAYKSRDDFFNRFDVTLKALESYIKPVACDRIGVRYIDQIKGEEFKKINAIIRPEIIGVHSHSVVDQIAGSMQQTVFTIDDEPTKLSSRWGKLEKGTTYDPGSLLPITEASWILDLDVFSEKKYPFKATDVCATARRYSDYAYSFFRWAVNNEFLLTYGGKLS